MRPECIEKVRAAAGGRHISDAKIKAIDDAISGKMRELARQDPEGWQAKSRDQRMTEAAQAARPLLDACRSPPKACSRPRKGGRRMKHTNTKQQNI